MSPIKNHSRYLLEAFLPVRVFLLITAQMPFSIHTRADGTNEFQFFFWNLNTLVFGFFCIANSLIYGMVSIGLFSILAGVRRDAEHSKINVTSPGGLLDGRIPWEEAMFENHLSLVIVAHTFLTLTFVSSMYLLFHGKAYVHYWNYWNRVVQTMDINPTKGVRCYLLFEIVLFIAIIATETVLFWRLPGIRATAGVYIQLFFRFIIPGLYGTKLFSAARICGFVIIVYGHLGARAIIIQFLFFTKILKNTAKVYNQRLENALKLYLKREPSRAKEQRQTFRLLLKDHLIIVQLFRMTNGVFGNILQAYYATELIALIFESFYMYKLLGKPGVQVLLSSNYSTIFPKIFPVFPNSTRQDEFDAQLLNAETFLTGVLMLQTVVSCFLTTSIAHHAHKEVMNGYKIIRQRGLVSCRTKTERNFVYNIITSFARSNPIILSASGYFSITKALFAGLIISVCGFLFPLLQFEFPRYGISEKAYVGN